LVSIGYDARSPIGSSGNLCQSVLLLRPRDLLIAFSFGRCLQDTVDAVLLARKNGIFTCGITDSDKSPLARFCDWSLVVSIAGPSFHGSYVAVVSVINALLMACTQIHPRRTLSTLRRKEDESRSRWYTPAAPRPSRKTDLMQ
ncbi:MAG TPA: SIS domain-containing protein, partial [Terriglobales bacterium]